MKIYTLLYEENSDSRCGADVFVFREKEAAFETMLAAYQKTAKILGFTISADHSFYDGDDERQCNITAGGASIQDGMDWFTWTIEEHEV